MFFAEKYLYEITPLMVEKYKAERLKNVSPATVNREMNVLKNIFTKAVEWKNLTENTIKKVKLLRTKNRRLRYLESEEITKLIENSAKHLKPIIIVALNTGMRRGEIFGLKWQNIDIKRGIIYLLDTKNGEKRELPMNDAVKKALIGVRKNPISSYVFCNPNGKPYQDTKRAFHTALNKAGIKNFRFHDLRHTFASQLVMLGVDLNTVRELLGHKTIEMTLRYSHLSPSHKKRATDLLSTKFDTKTTQLEKKQINAEKVTSVTLLNNYS